MAQVSLLGELSAPAPQIERRAVISDCGLYRYELRRIWNPQLRLLPVGMLNPAKADHRIDDPTVLVLEHFSRLWGYGGNIIVNMQALRTSSPAEMMAHANPEGPLNQQYIDQTLHYARHQDVPLLAAWGNGGVFNGRDQLFVERAAQHMVSLICLGLTKDGHPMHPMARGRNRIPRDRMPMMWRRASEVL